MDELMQTAGRYIGRFWTDISGARDPEEVADVARALVFTPLKAGLKRARRDFIPGGLHQPGRPRSRADRERRGATRTAEGAGGAQGARERG